MFDRDEDDNVNIVFEDGCGLYKTPSIPGVIYHLHQLIRTPFQHPTIVLQPLKPTYLLRNRLQDLISILTTSKPQDIP